MTKAAGGRDAKQAEMRWAYSAVGEDDAQRRGEQDGAEHSLAPLAPARLGGRARLLPDGHRRQEVEPQRPARLGPAPPTDFGKRRWPLRWAPRGFCGLRCCSRKYT